MPASLHKQVSLHVSRAWILAWFTVSSLVVLWDAAYIFARPHSFKGGQYHWIWQPYEIYQNVDYVYGWPSFERHDGFPAAQSSLNVIESLLNLTFVALHRSQPAEALVVGLSAVVMTISKTVLYWLNEYYSKFESIGHNDLKTLLLYWIIPNGVWLIVPSLIARVFVKDIVAGLKSGQTSGRAAVRKAQ